jgi:hypothetical protein
LCIIGGPRTDLLVIHSFLTMATSTKATLSVPGIPDDFFVVKKSGLSQAQALTAYLGGSAFQSE